MGRSKFGLSAITAALLVVVTVAGSCSLGYTPVDRLCPSARCRSNKVCRAVKTSTGVGCSPQVSCLKCVPIGVDDVCNRNHYFYAVVTGTPSEMRTLTELKCNINGPEEPKCPYGSVCLPDGNATGTCCYGKGQPPPDVDIVKNNDTVCPDKCGGCGPDSVCQLTVFPCLIQPCPTGYRCVDRECPVLPAFIPDYCAYLKEKSQCSTDKDCPGKLLCCSDQCSIRRCSRGFPV